MSERVRNKANRRMMNLRRPSVLMKILHKYQSSKSVHKGADGDLSYMDQSLSAKYHQKEKERKAAEGRAIAAATPTSDDIDIDIHRTYARSVIQRLFMNDPRFDKLELGIEFLKGCQFSELIRSLSMNDHLKHVVIQANFLFGICNHQKPEKARMLMELVGRLPALVSLVVEFPNSIKGSAATLLCDTVQYATQLQTLHVNGLRLVTDGEETELEEAFRNLHCLKKMVLSEFVVYKDVDADPFLEMIAQLPTLSHLDIRMKHKAEGNMKGMFFEALCESKSITSLIFWNMVLDMVQVTHVCEAITKSNNIKNFELWRCDLGPTFGILLTDVITNNRSLETLIISHVGFHGLGIVALTNAIKRKNNCKIRDLKLINVCDEQSQEVDAPNVTKSAIRMVNKQRIDNTDELVLNSVSITFNELPELDCIALDKQYKENVVLNKRRELILADRSKFREKFDILFGLVSKY